MKKKSKICIALGTRPEIIKLSPIIKECINRNLDHFLIHTGQHYSHKMDKIFFDNLELDYPLYNLKVGSGSHGRQTSEIIKKVEPILIKEQPDIVMVQGDTNSGMAVALTASKLHIKVAHVEAGLRSYDKRMPEELNRIINDHLSHILFVPTEEASSNAKKENIPSEKIIITGNTVVDAILQNRELSDKKSQILKKLGLVDKKYNLITLHRPENVDDKETLTKIVEGITRLHNDHNEIFLWPIHPRAKVRIEEFNLTQKLNELTKIKLILPVGYFDFLKLQDFAHIILTDSGGIQEEACILKVPCITLRDNTERPESVSVGANILVGSDADKLAAAYIEMSRIERNWKNPFGDGKSAEKIVDHLLKVKI